MLRIRYLSLIIVSLATMSFSIENISAGPNDISLSISPIREEFKIAPGTSTGKSLRFTNDSNRPITVYLSVEDCVPSGNFGTPICKPYVGSGVSLDAASTWFSATNASRWTIAPGATQVIEYTVRVPSGAIPGGRYGAVFLNNTDYSGNGSANSISTIRRIGMLYMMQVTGNVIVDTDVGKVTLDVWPGGGGGSIGQNTVNNIDITSFSSAPIAYVNKKIENLLMTFSDPEKRQKVIQDISPLWDTPSLPKESPFNVSLQIPVKNDGNVHIKPKGKVYIYDTDGSTLKNIGKESVFDDDGIYIGEKIVDYLPINDTNGNVLPNTEQTFITNWLGFGHEMRDEQNATKIVFDSPSVYYSKISSDGTRFIYPWEKLSLEEETKSLKAKVLFTYINPKTDTEDETTMDVPVEISYYKIARTFNTGAILLIGLILLLTFLIWKRNRRIHTLEEEVEEMEDEITVLEKWAKASLKKKTSAKKTPRTSSKKKEAELVEPKEKKSTSTKKTWAKPKTSRAQAWAKKETAEIQSSEPKKVTKKTPAKTWVKKTPAKKTEAKKTAEQ